MKKMHCKGVQRHIDDYIDIVRKNFTVEMNGGRDHG